MQGSNRACQGLCDTLAASADLGCVSESTMPSRRSPQQCPRRMLHVADWCCTASEAQVQTRLVAAATRAGSCHARAGTSIAFKKQEVAIIASAVSGAPPSSQLINRASERL